MALAALALVVFGAYDSYLILNSMLSFQMSHFLPLLLVVAAATLQLSLAAHFGSSRVENSIGLGDKVSLYGIPKN